MTTENGEESFFSLGFNHWTVSLFTKDWLLAVSLLLLPSWLAVRHKCIECCIDGKWICICICRLKIPIISGFFRVDQETLSSVPANTIHYYSLSTAVIVQQTINSRAKTNDLLRINCNKLHLHLLSVFEKELQLQIQLQRSHNLKRI